MTRLLRLLSSLRALVQQRQQCADPHSLSEFDLSLTRLLDGSYGFVAPQKAAREWEGIR